jgi:hypothetical protein
VVSPGLGEMKSALAAITAASASALAAPVFAAAVHEGNLTGPGFSDAYAAPTLLGEGVRQVTGTGASQAFQFFTFTLPAGAQALSFDFWSPEGVGYSYSPGNLVRRDATSGAAAEEPVAGTVESDELEPPAGRPLPRNRLRPSGRNAPPPAPLLPPTSVLPVPLDPGPFFTGGPLLSEPVVPDTEPAPSVVPLPGAGGMLLTAMGLAGLVTLGRRRRS